MHLETNRHLFTDDFKLRVHEGGKTRYEKVDTRQFVTGYVEGKCTLYLEVTLCRGFYKKYFTISCFRGERQLTNPWESDWRPFWRGHSEYGVGGHAGIVITSLTEQDNVYLKIINFMI